MKLDNSRDTRRINMKEWPACECADSQENFEMSFCGWLE